MPVDWDGLVIGPTQAIFSEAIPVQYTGAAGTIPITGIFDEAYLEVAPLGRGGIDMEGLGFGSPGAITTEMPALGVQLSQFPAAPAQGDTLIVRGCTYAVKEVRLDGRGAAVLLLNALVA